MVYMHIFKTLSKRIFDELNEYGFIEVDEQGNIFAK